MEVGPATLRADTDVLPRLFAQPVTDNVHQIGARHAPDVTHEQPPTSGSYGDYDQDRVKDEGYMESATKLKRLSTEVSIALLALAYTVPLASMIKKPPRGTMIPSLVTQRAAPNTCLQVMWVIGL
jgi:hypothetical protein